MNAIENGELPEPKWRHPLIDPRLIIGIICIVVGQAVTGLILIGGIGKQVENNDRRIQQVEGFMLTAGPSIAEIRSKVGNIDTQVPELKALIGDAISRSRDDLRQHEQRDHPRQYPPG